MECVSDSEIAQMAANSDRAKIDTLASVCQGLLTSLSISQKDIATLKKQNKDLLLRVERLEGRLYRATEVLRGDE